MSSYERVPFRAPLSALAMEDILTMEFDGPIAILTLNRPAVLNALNSDLLTLLEETLDAFTGDPALRAVILTGSGERAFAAGADIAELAALENAVAGQHKARTGQRVTQLLEALPVPTIAAVNGFALGGGCELAMACDFRIASENAKFGQPEVNLGVPPGYGGTQRTTRLLGPGMALFMCLTGEMIDAAEAFRIGLVQRVVPIGDLLPEAKRIAHGIAAKAPLAVTATKRAIRDGAALPLPQALALEALHFGTMVSTNDFREGTSAFLEKRKPAFTGN
jgi:enoyl-CoA hydratase